MNGIIYGVTSKDAEEELEFLIYNYVQKGIEIETKTRRKNFVQFVNGDTWRAVRANDNVRGLRWNVAYIDERLKNTPILHEVILPKGMSTPYYAWRFF